MRSIAILESVGLVDAPDYCTAILHHIHLHHLDQVTISTIKQQIAQSRHFKNTGKMKAAFKWLADRNCIKPGFAKKQGARDRVTDLYLVHPRIGPVLEQMFGDPHKGGTPEGSFTPDN